MGKEDDSGWQQRLSKLIEDVIAEYRFEDNRIDSLTQILITEATNVRLRDKNEALEKELLQTTSRAKKNFNALTTANKTHLAEIERLQATIAKLRDELDRQKMLSNEDYNKTKAERYKRKKEDDDDNPGPSKRTVQMV